MEFSGRVQLWRDVGWRRSVNGAPSIQMRAILQCSSYSSFDRIEQPVYSFTPSHPTQVASNEQMFIDAFLKSGCVVFLIGPGYFFARSISFDATVTAASGFLRRS